ncbi:MAG: hypothetical protein R6W87_04830 [Halospina sp.]
MPRRVFRFLSRLGIVVTLLGMTGLLLGFLGVLQFDDYAVGLSAGVRMLGSVAIAGCLISAIGFLGLEYGP